MRKLFFVILSALAATSRTECSPLPQAPPTSAPVSVKADPAYRLVTGDVISIAVGTQPNHAEISAVRTIGGSGSVRLPWIKEEIFLAGKTVGEAEDLLQDLHRARTLMKRPVAIVKVIQDATPVASGNTYTQKEAGPPAPAAELSVADAITLGVIEGVTEYLPISSTGHLIIVSRLLGLESEKPLVGRDGRPLWYRKPSPKHPEGEPLTLKLAADTYTVVIQFGAIAAVAILYWSQLMAMLRGLLGRDPAGLRLLINVLIAFLPAVLVYFVAHDWINRLFTVGKVIVAQVAGAVLMLFAESWRRRRAVLVKHVPESSELTYRQVAGIGLLQCVAMWPGTSRSMMTIVGGYFAGLDPRRAAEFSFLLGFVTLSAAAILKSSTSGAAMIEVFGWSHVILGAVVAAITAAISVRFLVSWLTRHGLVAFALYRLVLAAVLGALFYL